MRKRWRWWVVAGLTLVVIAAMNFLYPHAPSRLFTREQFLQLGEGVTLAEAESALGCPPGDYTTTVTQPVAESTDEMRMNRFGYVDVPFATEACWYSDTAMVYMRFDASGKATLVAFLPQRRASVNPLHNFVWRVKRQWRRWFP